MSAPPVAPESWECANCLRRNRARTTCWNCAAPYVTATGSHASTEASPLSSGLTGLADDAGASSSSAPESEPHVRGMRLWAEGHHEAALTLLTEAADMGSAQAMKDAGDVAGEMGRRDEARSWYERSATAGLPDAYVALARAALDSGDEVAAQRWAKLGADAGQTFCMVLYGKQLAAGPRAGSQSLQQARDYLERAAGLGDVSAAGPLAEVNSRLGDDARARRYIRMLQDSGNQEEIERLHRLGYL